MTGRTRKKRRGPKKTSAKKVVPPVTGQLRTAPGSPTAVTKNTSPSLSPQTPRSGKEQGDQMCLTSTPRLTSSVDRLTYISPSSSLVEKVELENCDLTHVKSPDVDSPCSISTTEGRHKNGRAARPRRIIKTLTETCRDSCVSATRHQRGRKRKTKLDKLKECAANELSKRCRPRFELKKAETDKQDDSLPSSDLSIELSSQEEQMPYLSFQEDEENEYEEEEEEDELPSFLTQANKRPHSVSVGAFVWSKFRNCPFWPALVKGINRRLKKASIMFVEDSIIQRKKGFTVALKTLKPFDCEEADELVSRAKEKYGVAIELAVELIDDYRIKKACGSFSGSFIEYYIHDMSYPVRRKFPQATSEVLSIASDAVLEELEDICDEHKEDLSLEQQKVGRTSKRLLPDRTHAAHNRANEKLVHFIVKQRMVEEHLLAVIRGQQQSRWLHSYLNATRRRVVNIYLEDDEQLDQVYLYLSELYTTALDSAPCLVNLNSMERVPFILDVLLPEAVINAIAGVDNIPIEKAEDKYLKGRRIGHREKQQFDLMIERQMRKKSQTNALARFSEPVN